MLFPLGTVLTVTTGRLLCPIGDLYGILDHLTGESLMTHQLPRASREAAPRIIEQYPNLADVEVPDGLSTEEAVSAWLDQLRPTLGAELNIEPLSDQDHTRIDPITELRMMRPDAPVIVVTTEPDE